MTGEALFVLSEDNQAFVADSRRAARRAWVRSSFKFVGGIAAVFAAGLLAVAFWPEDPRVRLEFNKSFNEIDRYTTEMLGSFLDSGKGGDGPLLVLQQIGEGNYPYDDYVQFMHELREEDRNALKDMDTSNARYEKMALKYEAAARANPNEPSGWVMAKTVRWHQFWLGSPLQRDASAAPLMRLMREPRPAQLGGADFGEDIAEICGDFANSRIVYDGCPELPLGPPGEASDAAPDKQVEPDPAG